VVPIDPFSVAVNVSVALTLFRTTSALRTSRSIPTGPVYVPSRSPAASITSECAAPGVADQSQCRDDDLRAPFEWVQQIHALLLVPRPAELAEQNSSPCNNPLAIRACERTRPHFTGQKRPRTSRNAGKGYDAQIELRGWNQGARSSRCSCTGKSVKQKSSQQMQVKVSERLSRVHPNEQRVLCKILNRRSGPRS